MTPDIENIRILASRRSGNGLSRGLRSYSSSLSGCHLLVKYLRYWILSKIKSSKQNRLIPISSKGKRRLKEKKFSSNNSLPWKHVTYLPVRYRKVHKNSTTTKALQRLMPTSKPSIFTEKIYLEQLRMGLVLCAGYGSPPDESIYRRACESSIYTSYGLWSSRETCNHKLGQCTYVCWTLLIPLLGGSCYWLFCKCTARVQSTSSFPQAIEQVQA